MASTSNLSEPLGWGRRAPGVVFTLALVSALPVWWLIAIPLLSGAPQTWARHGDHLAWTYAHGLLGTAMLFSGALALWIGWTRRLFRLHRWVGGTYLVSGLITSGAALWLTGFNVHRDMGQSVATGSLAAAWLVTAAMAFRAIRNRRIDSHKEWVIRSYVLTWSFVFCRGVGQILPMDAATMTAVLWLTWVGPLLICEVALQWAKGAPRSAKP